MPLSNAILIGLLIFYLPLSTLSKYPVVLTTNDKIPIDFTLNFDFGYNHILIHSSKIDCDKLESCKWYDPKQKEQTDVYNNEEYNYKNAYINVLVKMPNTENPDDNETMLLNLFVRINDEFNILGMNDINGIASSMEHKHEVVVDLKTSTMIIQSTQKSKGK